MLCMQPILPVSEISIPGTAVETHLQMLDVIALNDFWLLAAVMVHHHFRRENGCSGKESREPGTTKVILRIFAPDRVRDTDIPIGFVQSCLKLLVQTSGKTSGKIAADQPHLTLGSQGTVIAQRKDIVASSGGIRRSNVESQVLI